MNGWITLTPPDVLNQFNDSETTAYDAAKGDSGGTALGDIIAKVADQVQQAYSDAGRLYDTVAQAAPPTGSVPAGDANRVVAIIRWRYLLALPTGKSLAENRAAEAEQAEKYFLLVAQRKIKLGGAGIARPGRHLHTHSFDRLGTT